MCYTFLGLPNCKTAHAIVFYFKFKMESKKIKRQEEVPLCKQRLKMLKLKKRTDQEEESRSLLADSVESFSKQAEEVLHVETGATSSFTT